MVKGNKFNPNEFDSEYYYFDDKCEKLEEIIRTQQEFSNCRVKRLSQAEIIGGNHPASEDPFAVISSEGKLMAWVYPWELEALNNPDILLAYLTVETERTKISDKSDFSMLILGVLIPIMAFALATMLIFSGGRPLNPLQSGYFIFVIGITFSIVLMLYRKVKHKRNLLTDLDIRYARETAEFREALRILASLIDHYELFDVAKYVKRYKIIEDALVSGS